jgi:DNA-binding response OmpR family regulator
VKASAGETLAGGELAAPAAFGEPPAPVGDGLLLHAAVSRAIPAMAVIAALSRREPSAPPVLRHGDLAVDRARHRATRGDYPLCLTRKEFGILEMLLAADGAVVSAEELLEHVWDAHADPFSNIVSVTMARLRRKIGDPPLIETVVGKGYRM